MYLLCVVSNIVTLNPQQIKEKKNWIPFGQSLAPNQFEDISYNLLHYSYILFKQVT